MQGILADQACQAPVSPGATLDGAGRAGASGLPGAGARGGVRVGARARDGALASAGGTATIGRPMMPRPIRVLPLAVTVVALAGGCRKSNLSEETAPAEPAGRAPAARTAAEPGSEPPRRPAAEPAAAPAERDPESGRLVGITAAHNRVRAGLGIAPLTWSPALAEYARQWAEKLQRRGCDLQHRPRKGPDAQRHGENLYGSTGHSPTAAEVVETWAAEVRDYDPRSNTCKGVCGHYTQVVWRKSQRLGCAMAACGETEVWVCNYDPPGNFLGERPY